MKKLLLFCIITIVFKFIIYYIINELFCIYYKDDVDSSSHSLFQKLNINEAIKIWLVEDIVSYLIHMNTHQNRVPFFKIIYHDDHHRGILSITSVIQLAQVALTSGFIGYCFKSYPGFLFGAYSSVYSNYFVHILLSHGSRYSIKSMSVHHSFHHKIPKKHNYGTENVLWDILFLTYK